MASVSAFDAKTRFGELLKRVARGEEVVITRHDKPVARIVPEGVAGGAAGKRAAAALLELQHAIGRRSGTKPLPGSGPAAAGSPHGREPMVSWSSRRLSSWTGSPISSRRRGSTGIATTGYLRRITSSGGQSRRWRSATLASGARPRPAGHGNDGHGMGASVTQTSREWLTHSLHPPWLPLLDERSQCAIHGF